MARVWYIWTSSDKFWWYRWKIYTGSQIKQRTGHLFKNSEMSDITLNACDENWWYGDTVKDFNAHRFLLGTASPIFHKILYGQVQNMFSWILNLQFFSRNFMFHFLEGCKVSFSVMINSYIGIFHLNRKLLPCAKKKKKS